MNKYKLSLASLCGFFILWQSFGHFHWIDTDLFPKPYDIVLDCIRILSTGQMWQHLFASFYRVVMAFILAWPAAIILAVLTGYLPFLKSILTPFVNFLYPLPKVALLPLFLVFFGIGEFSKIMLIAMGIFFLVYISVLNGFVRLMSHPIFEVTKVYNITGTRFWINIVSRGLFLDILTGTKAAFGYALVLMVVSEAQMTQKGLGYFIWQAWEQYRIIELYDSLFLLGLIGIFTGTLFDKFATFLVKKYSL